MIIEKTEYGNVEFRLVNPGDVFEYENEFYMRTARVTEQYANTPATFNAVSLKTGYHIGLLDTSLVKPYPDAKLIIN